MHFVPPVAQSVEQLPFKERVEGSIPPGRTMSFTHQIFPFVIGFAVSFLFWALFAGKYEGDKIERVRKTTKKNAEEILHPASLYAMCAQYKHENSMDIVTECFDAILPDRVEIKNRIFLSD